MYSHGEQSPPAGHVMELRQDGEVQNRVRFFGTFDELEVELTKLNQSATGNGRWRRGGNFRYGKCSNDK